MSFSLYACDIINYHPYDGRLTIDECQINSYQIEKIESKTKGKDTIRFALIGDTQKSYDETVDFVKHINSLPVAIDFVIHGGDFTEFGTTKEYEWAVNSLSKLTVPYVGLIGNHDVLGNGDRVYEKLFGDDNFSFVCGNVKFLCLNTNAYEYDYSHPVPDFGFLKKELADTTKSYSRTIVAMHARPGSEQFDNNVMDVFQYSIKKFPSLMFCLNAHDHSVEIEDIFDDGILYYGCSNIAKRNYLLFTLTEDSYSYEVVYF